MQYKHKITNSFRKFFLCMEKKINAYLSSIPPLSSSIIILFLLRSPLNSAPPVPLIIGVVKTVPQILLLPAIFEICHIFRASILSSSVVLYGTLLLVSLMVFSWKMTVFLPTFTCAHLFGETLFLFLTL